MREGERERGAEREKERERGGREKGGEGEERGERERDCFTFQPQVVMFMSVIVSVFLCIHNPPTATGKQR